MEQFLSQYGRVPLVTVDYKIPGVPCLLQDDGKGFRKLMDHLLGEHGFRKIAYIGGGNENFNSYKRYNIYGETLKEKGIQEDPRLVFQGDFSYLSGRRAVQEFFLHHKLKPPRGCGRDCRS